jgi:regulator of sigma E protease
MPSKTQKILESMAGKPAAAAGLAAGDVLVAANGHAVSVDAPISDIIRAGQGAPVTVQVLRKGQPMTFVVKPEHVASGAYQIGIGIGPVDERTPVALPAAVKEAVVYPYYTSAGILGNLYDIIRGRVHADLSGPIGITKEMAKAADRGAIQFLSLVAMLSVYLGLFNLLPVPALDGARALFIAAESVLRRRVNPRVEATVHTVGFVLLLGVLVIVTFKDARALFGKG